MADEDQKPKTEEKKKGLPPIAMVGIGCLAILVLLSIVGSAITGFLASRFGFALFKKGVEMKTGISINTEKGKEGFTYKDKETGAEVVIGQEKIPDTFPKDFPIYPGAKPAGTMSGADKKQEVGFWLMLTTKDAVEKVDAYYQKELKANGWTAGQSFAVKGSSTVTVSKGDLAGSVTIAGDEKTKETSIVILLGSSTDKTKPQTGKTPTEEPTPEE